MAGQYAPDHSTTKLQYKFKEIVEAESNGEIEIKVYPANQLGDYTQVYEELRRGPSIWLQFLYQASLTRDLM